MNKEIPKYVGEKIKFFRTNNNITQQELAEYLKTTSQTISRYENGVLETNNNVLFSLADFFKVSINDFFPPTSNKSNLSPIKLDRDVVKIPVLGRIPAGMPFEAIEDEYTIDYEEIPKEWLKGGKEYFALKIDGDSMEPDFKDKDTVVFLKSPTCESGQYCCVKVNGYDATFKKVQIQENGILLSPLNIHNSTGYMPTFYTNEQIKNLPVEIIGVAKRYIGDL